MLTIVARGCNMTRLTLGSYIMSQQVGKHVLLILVLLNTCFSDHCLRELRSRRERNVSRRVYVPTSVHAARACVLLRGGECPVLLQVQGHVRILLNNITNHCEVWTFFADIKDSVFFQSLQSRKRLFFLAFNGNRILTPIWRSALWRYLTSRFSRDQTSLFSYGPTKGVGDTSTVDMLTEMHRSAKLQTPPNAVDLLWSCESLWRGLSFVFSRSDCHLTIKS